MSERIEARCLVPFAYAVGDQVMLRATEYPGQITGLMQDATGAQYRVVWWKDGERRCEWLYAYELAVKV